MRKLVAMVFAVGLAVATQATSYTFVPSNADLSDLAHNSAYTWGILGSDGSATNPLNTETALKNELISGDSFISSATISIDDLYNWDKADTDNRLFIHLLDNPKAGVKTITDDPTDTGINQGVVSDYFDGKIPGNKVSGKWVAYGYANTSAGALLANGATNIYLTQYHDLDGPQTTVDWTFQFSTSDLTTLASYITNGHTGTGYADFGLGFDPDCHFYNNGVTLTINTSHVSVPDGGFTLGLLGIGLLVLFCFARRRRKRARVTG